MRLFDFVWKSGWLIYCAVSIIKIHMLGKELCTKDLRVELSVHFVQVLYYSLHAARSTDYVQQPAVEFPTVFVNYCRKSIDV